MDTTLEVIQARRSDRVPYSEARPVRDVELRKILEAARWAPTAHNMQNFEIVVVDDRNVLGAIAAIKRPVSKTFLKENYEQLSFSEKELEERKVGLLGTMFPPFMRRPDGDIPADGAPLPPSPTLLVVLYDPARRAPASEGDFLGIMSLGCVMENMWLAASSLGIGFHVISSLASPPAARELKTILGIPSRFQVAFACRLGYPTVEPGKYLRVRRQIEDFTHRNRYGSTWK